MAAPDKKTVIRDLIELGKSKGQLTTKEILDAIGELDFDPEHIEKFYDTLESHGIEIIDDFSDIQIDDIDLSKVSGADTDDFDAGMGMEGVAIDDPVKVYLKEIGRVPPASSRWQWPWSMTGQRRHSVVTKPSSFRARCWRSTKREARSRN